jgi:hypothetical protein
LDVLLGDLASAEGAMLADELIHRVTLVRDQWVEPFVEMNHAHRPPTGRENLDV